MTDVDFTADTFVGNFSNSKACSLLEIVSVSTGVPLSQALPVRAFVHHSRYVYASEFQKKHNDQFSKFPVLDELTVQINSVNTKFNIAFVDPWHEIEDSFQIIEIALKHLHSGATLIVHDCHPRNPDLRAVSAPEVFPYAWCGSTWTAWSLLTQALTSDFSWMTIDADYGIGVLQVPETDPLRRQLLRLVRSLSKQWTSGNLCRPEWSADAEHLHLVAPDDPRVAAWT